MLYLDNTNSFSLKKLTLATLKSFILEGRVWNWAGQAGQPNWLWGSNDGINQYVWNPGAFNVDMVDGLHGANLVYGGVNKKSNFTTNMNDLTQKSGFYYGNTMTGAPDGNWYMYINAYGDSWADANTYGFQLANQFWDDQLWFRRVNNGVYQPWIKIGSGGGVGVGQTWQDLTSSRAFGTTYTNTTGHPIVVSINHDLVNAGANLTLNLNGITTGLLCGNNQRGLISIIVPNGNTYMFSGNVGLLKWLELR